MIDAAARDRMLKLHIENWEYNRMYPPGHRKESSVTDLEKFITYLRRLAGEAPPTLIKMPPNDIGLPEGKFIPVSFLNYLADCLEGKLPESSSVPVPFLNYLADCLKDTID